MFTDYMNNIYMDWEFRGIVSEIQSLPQNLYIGLSTTPVLSDGSGVTEPIDSSYQRVSIKRVVENWGDFADGYITCFINKSFPRSSQEWGNIMEIFISTGATVGGGNVLYHRKLSPIVYIGEKTMLTINNGSIVIEIE